MILSHRTALVRKGPSLPARMAVGLRPRPRSIFDFGCGRGADIEFFRSKGIEADGYDPYWRPRDPKIIPADLVTCIYVLNVITPSERVRVLKEIRGVLREGGEVLVAVRSRSDVEKRAGRLGWRKYSDGYLTKAETFQRGFTPTELKGLLTENGFGDVQILFRNGSALVALAWASGSFAFEKSEAFLGLDPVVKIRPYSILEFRALFPYQPNAIPHR